ncbi:60S ribosomal protein L14 [Schizosaccharomyces japonicus yFS275]|uniref:60S ribosomal protein L14 n=1 Tax=Schizosaccharomyces japonicus (strain yFS275 / FY16936) TaxID=402676 RepID=B6K0H1_SCHJY|nr:60S ribosomal protein L14 [Schizosaccharomyces japonicus yFS275]EEB06321.1 60S ribosomal protein L14 [Schizosaccharomyces japonicus yFS275]
MEGFKRYVEVGRIALVNKGAYKGKLAVIVDIVDHKRAVFDSPCPNFPRQVISYGDVILTSIVMDLPRGARTGVVAKKWKAQEICKKWESSAWAKKLETQKVRSQLSDFDRFAVMRLKKQRRNEVRVALAKA